MTVLCVLFSEATAGATDEPEDVPVHGREEDRQLPGEPGRDFADALLWPVREGFSYFIRAQAAVARFVHDRQLVPRARRRLSGGTDADVFVFPTLFAETDRTLNVGARMVVRADPWGSSARVGFGGPKDVVTEGIVQVTPSFGDVGIALSVEGFAEAATDRRFLGVGQRPEDDPRNRRRSATVVALYDERRTRVLVAGGVRPHRWFQALVSTSLVQRYIQPPDEVDRGIDAVFQPGTVTTLERDTWVSYTELAVRVDTRPVVGAPRPGVMAEGYGGAATETQGQPVGLVRAGGRLGAFIPVYRATNLISPRLVVDTVTSTGPDVPFTELVRQPAYRGNDNRRDDVSVVASLDYIWQFASVASARVFVDAAVVGDGFDALPLAQTRVAGGAGLDLFTDNVDIGRFWIAGSGDGLHLHLSIGNPSRFGDRQRRD